MTDISQALYEFWSGFTDRGQPIAVYKSGHVPKKAAFPYFTFSVTRGAFFGKTVLTAILWCKQSEGLNVNAQRAAILDQVARAIPEGGRMIPLEGGGVWLMRNDADFLSDYEPEDEEAAAAGEEPVIGGRVSYTAQYFIF